MLPTEKGRDKMKEISVARIERRCGGIVRSRGPIGFMSSQDVFQSDGATFGFVEVRWWRKDHLFGRELTLDILSGNCP